MNRITRSFTLSAASLAIVALLAACGGGDASAPDTTAAAGTGTGTSTGTGTGTGTTTPSSTDTTSGTGTGTGTTSSVAAQTITFTNPGTQTMGTAVAALAATSTSNLAVSYASTSAAVCTVAGSTVTLVSAGTCVIVASQAGNSSFAAAANVTQSFTVQAKPVVVASTAVVTFDESTAPTLTDFGSTGVSSVATDPAGGTNKVGKFVRAADAETWAGTTISRCSGLSLPTLPFTATATTLTARVWSPTAGIPVRLKVENATDGTKSVETEAKTTKVNEWETLSFDFSKQVTGTAALNTATVYNKASVFFNFGATGATAGAKTYYLDDLTFPGTTFSAACPTTTVSGTGTALIGGKFASNFTQVDATNWKTTEGGNVQRYIDNTVATLDWWNGVAPADATPSYYFGYGINVNAKPWGFGTVVNAPANGTALMTGYTSMNVSVWGNDELMGTNPTLTVVLKGPAVNACAAEVQGTIAVKAKGAQNYTVPFSGMTLKTACGLTSVAGALATGLNEVHIQVLGNNVQYSVGGSATGDYANGLNVGPIKFN